MVYIYMYNPLKGYYIHNRRPADMPKASSFQPNVYYTINDTARLLNRYSIVSDDKKKNKMCNVHKLYS